MKNKILFSLFVLVVSMFSSLANASEKKYVYMSHCANYGTGVNYSFQSCVNSNFSTVGRELGGYFSFCANYGDEVSYSFTSCVNSGFNESARLLDHKVFLQYCNNFDPKNLDYSFISCVNSNFSQIARSISEIE